MATLVQLQAKCLNRVEEAFQQAEAALGRKFNRVPVEFCNRTTRRAGAMMYNRVNLTPIKITLSNKLLTLNPDAFIAETPGHEAAHAIALMMYGPRGTGHGPGWRYAMKLIGQDPKVFHNMATPKRGKLYVYEATDGTLIELTSVRHKKIQYRGAGYLLKSGGRINASCKYTVKD